MSIPDCGNHPVKVTKRTIRVVFLTLISNDENVMAETAFYEA